MSSAAMISPIGKFKNIQELINAMEDSRLEEMCEFIKQQEKRETN